MTEKQIITLWKKGLSKNKLAEIYRREYNEQIKTIRRSTKHRHDGRFVTNYEALYQVEKTICKYLRNGHKNIDKIKGMR